MNHKWKIHKEAKRQNGNLWYEHWRCIECAKNRKITEKGILYDEKGKLESLWHKESGIHIRLDRYSNGEFWLSIFSEISGIYEYVKEKRFLVGKQR